MGFSYDVGSDFTFPYFTNRLDTRKAIMEITERITQLGKRHVAKTLGLLDEAHFITDNLKKGVKAEIWNLVNDINLALSGKDEYYNGGSNNVS